MCLRLLSCQGGLLVIFLLSPLFAGEKLLFEDGFSRLSPGMFSAGVIGAHAEYHYLPQVAPKGGWVVSAFKSDGSQRAWRVIREMGRNLMAQTYASPASDAEYTHPVLVAGDEWWKDYTLSVEFQPESDQAQSGILFRYRNDQCYYFFGVKNSQAILKVVKYQKAFHQADERLLAAAALPLPKPARFKARVRVNGSRIRAVLDESLVLEAEDATYASGRIGLLSDVPTRYYQVSVTTSPPALAKYEKERTVREAELRQARSGNPSMVLWKKIETPGFGVGRNLRFGDLDGDGRLEVLISQPLHHGPRDQFSEVGCLTAISLEGKVLWQVGQPDGWRDHLTNDVGVQVHDLDGDGHTEVVYCQNLEIVVADGATGKTKYKAPTPEVPASPGGKPPRFPRILGDSLFFCDVRGTGKARDLLIKDRYQNFWVYDDQLRPLWKGSCKTGHYPFASDIDQDGKDELFIGYSLFDHDGRLLWSLDRQIQDHADGIALADFDQNPATPPGLLCAASDEGIFFADLQGKVFKHHYLGHVQNPSIADFRTDLPGLEAVTINFWGNQGIIHFFDAKGNLYQDCEPVQHGSMMLPVNWTGEPPEFFVLSPSVAEGGLFDGWGRKVVEFPADGHPDLCNAVLDLTGDCRDEIVVWDPWELWVYTQADNPRPGRLYRPRRNALFNSSNYQANFSLPGWSE